ncbi:MAG: hypothetical protein LKI03_04350, partial [Acetobacter indonesiensis]|nr:hypothetical protein [Acetobacter indonesiensis]MCI1765266.1 hypothetical protein [Acetobacter indonesiensis]
QPSNLADLLKPAKTSTASVKRFLYPHPQHVNTKSTHYDKFLTNDGCSPLRDIKDAHEIYLLAWEP